uniref:CARD domain-containing protein n=1 Tax=Globodera pallida TaxID=36090 RepID=A0A183BJ11_GLOPA
MFCTSSDFDKRNYENLKENELQEVLKNYYELCKNTRDKRMLIKDVALVQTLSNLLDDTRCRIQILLSLTNNPEDAKMVADCTELNVQLKKAVDDRGNHLPRILRKFLVVQTRIYNAKSNIVHHPTSPPRKSIFRSTVASKLLIFTIECPDKTLKREIERQCIGTVGVVSFCFQYIDGSDEVRCLIRCLESVDAKSIASVILRSGTFESVKQIVRNIDGATETFYFYADQLGQEQNDFATQSEKEKPNRHLDDLDMFDKDQCIATKEQVNSHENRAGWLSSLKSLFW